MSKAGFILLIRKSLADDEWIEYKIRPLRLTTIGFVGISSDPLSGSNAIPASRSFDNISE